MAARASRSASRKARLTEAVATGPLGALSHDELGVIVDGLADPLLPAAHEAVRDAIVRAKARRQATTQ